MKTNIRRIRKELGLTQTDLADRLGINWQTVSNAERYVGKGLSTEKLEAYAAALGVPVHKLIDTSNGIREVVVRGYVQAGHYAEDCELHEDDRYPVFIPDDIKYQDVALYARETRGPSMNRRYPEGTVVIHTDAIETGEDIIPGKRYIVERERADGLREATVKKLWVDGEGCAWLLPESDDPRFQEPIALDGEEGDTIRIVGRVRFMVGRED